MKIELKRIAFYARMSEETNCFNADLYINGKRVGYAKNDGQGGCTDYYGNTKEDNVLIAEAEAYCKTLPPLVTHDFTLAMNLELFIDNLLEKHLTEKETQKHQKKMVKLMVDSIIIGVPNSDRFSYFQQKKPLSTYPKDTLQNWVNNIKAKHCTNGVVILNTNLVELGLTI